MVAGLDVAPRRLLQRLTGYRPQSLGIYDLPTNFRVGKPDAVTLPEHA